MKKPAFPRRLATLAFAAAGAGFLYAGGPSGKEARAADCAGAAKVAAAVKDLVKSGRR